MNQIKAGISRRVAEFCRFLRVNGFSIGVQETVDAFRTLGIISLDHRQTVQSSLRALLCSSQEEYESFDGLFEQFWNPAISLATPRSRREESSSPVAPEGRLSRSISMEMEETQTDRKETTGASAQEQLRKMDFSKVTDDDLVLLEEIALRLWKRMSVRMIRRWKAHGQEDRLDLRRTIRHSIGYGGDPVYLRYMERKKKRIHLVTLLDISGSMDLYSTFLLRFLFALHRYFRRVDSFLFGTRLTHVSHVLGKERLPIVLKTISQNVEDWSGGTRIGDCLREFNRTHARKILTRNSLMVILSDGWDTGSPQALADELREIKQRIRKLIWLNPLLGLPDYEPLTRGMAAALPLLDVFAPAHSVQSLLDLEKQWV